ncbi:AraC family transcriptional regulator [Fulvivirgaceae bacterium BMA10]|uniref:AraC family transcriptional regulator n=1 Tax=Splendidivirga corallicola TaxID=3051826 RepID=A0ABT8KNQ3_9BACT|nr:AraC family transcriptional regulator [Fulvivirgaceae bacterium BMA10]
MSDIPLYSIPDPCIEFSGFKLYSLKSLAQNATAYPKFPVQTDIPHRHDFYEMCIFYKGEGTHEIDFSKFPINNYSVHFVTPGQVHLISNHQHAQGYILAFTEEFVALNKKPVEVKIGELPSPYLDMNKHEFKFVWNILDAIMHEYSHPGEESEEIIKSYLHILILKSKNLYGKTEKTKKKINPNTNTIFRSFKDLVEKNYRTNQLVNFYADHLNISPSHLNKISKKICGRTAGNFIHDRVILEAKRLLVFSDMTSQEIAYHLMYNDPSYFSRIFKRKTGYSPTRFREIKLQKYHHLIE